MHFNLELTPEFQNSRIVKLNNHYKIHIIKMLLNYPYINVNKKQKQIRYIFNFYQRIICKLNEYTEY